jgi:molybdate transport system substrate-binding protein
MRRVFSLIFLAIATATALPAQQVPLRIAAAADLQPVLPAILTSFQQQYGRNAVASYQSSATLAAQIENGAPFDIFLSADMSFPQRLISERLTEEATPLLYAHGTLVLWARKNSRFPNPSLETLKDPQLKRLAVANPDHAPYGRAAMALLTQLGLVDALRSKLVTAENIAQTAQFVDSGNADAGLISLTSALTPHLREDGNYFPIPRNLYPPIEQGAVILKRSSDSRAAHQFLNYLLSRSIQEQLSVSGLAAAK